MNSRDLRDLHESFSNIINEQVTSTTHDWKRGVDKAPPAPTLPPSPEAKKRNQLPKRTAANAANVQYYKDDVDVFDLVKGHLIDEGYADNEEAALAIMSNMSEEWRQSIVEQARSREFSHSVHPSRSTSRPPSTAADYRSRGGQVQHMGRDITKSASSGGTKSTKPSPSGREKGAKTPVKSPYAAPYKPNSDTSGPRLPGRDM
jgi:hypothetical protein